MMSQSKRIHLQRTFEDRHFFPQNWRCDFNRYPIESFHLIKYTSNSSLLLQQLEPLLNSKNVPFPSFEFLKKELNIRTVHSTFSSKARRFIEKIVGDSPFLMEYLVRMFYYDYVLFNFELPNITFT